MIYVFYKIKTKHPPPPGFANPLVFYMLSYSTVYIPEIAPFISLFRADFWIAMPVIIRGVW